MTDEGLQCLDTMKNLEEVWFSYLGFSERATTIANCATWKLRVFDKSPRTIQSGAYGAAESDRTAESMHHVLVRLINISRTKSKTPDAFFQRKVTASAGSPATR